MLPDNHDLIVASRARLELLERLSWMVALEKVVPMIARLTKEEKETLRGLVSKDFIR